MTLDQQPLVLPQYKSAYVTLSLSFFQTEEVTYAELCLARPPIATELAITPTRKEEPTIYAQIDHSRRGTLGLDTNVSQREIVTVRTPLMNNQQESCV